MKKEKIPANWQEKLLRELDERLSKPLAEWEAARLERLLKKQK